MGGGGGGKKRGLGFVVKYRFVSTAIPGNGVDSTVFSIWADKQQSKFGK